MTVYSLDVLLSQLVTSLLFNDRFNCCFLTCIQISQEAGKVVWYSHLKEFSTVCCDPHSQRRWLVNKAEGDVVLVFSCFFDDPADVGALISASSAFS